MNNVQEAKPSATEQHFAAVRAVHESPLLGAPCPVCTGGTIGQSGTFLRCGNCGWLRDPGLSDRHRRPCTCHPDDNPPTPCAQQYALTECRAKAGTTSPAVRYVVYHCPGCQLHITRTIGKTGEFLRAMKKRRNFCATSGKVETMTRVREVFR